MKTKGSAYHLAMLMLGVVGATMSIITIIFSIINVLRVTNAR